MTANRKRVIVGLAAVALVALAGTQAMAQCFSCGETIAYQPVTYQTYSPVAYETYRPYTSWYPGYWIGRMNNYVWGRPLLPSYHAWYRRAYMVGYTPTTMTYYAPATSCCAPAESCSSCTSYYSPCSTCSTVSQVVMQPICSDACTTTCDPCAGACSSCPTGVSQATYETPACGNCAVAQPAPVAAPPVVAPPAAAPPVTPPPTLSPSETPSPERTYRDKPVDNSVMPAPAESENDKNSTYFEAPKLFNPQDRTAERNAAPVYNAVYHKVASQTAAEPVSVRQYDASGWVSASK
jgi:hypothetical protein